MILNLPLAMGIVWDLLKMKQNLIKNIKLILNLTNFGLDLINSEKYQTENIKYSEEINCAKTKTWNKTKIKITKKQMSEVK